MTTLTKEQFIDMLHGAADSIEAEHELLSALDAVTGDGDHGVTILRTMKAVREAVKEHRDKPLAELTKHIAMYVMTCDGGSTSPLLGSYFLGLSAAAPNDVLSPKETASMFISGYDSLQKMSTANVGDKTMIDALQPATEGLVSQLEKDGNIPAAFAVAANRAAQGAEKTKDYVARFGRARTMGERAVGHLDPGAMSISYIFKGFADSCQA